VDAVSDGWTWLHDEGWPGAKLAGSSLGNFGAFFSRRWRQNDWWWGRLDAAAGILHYLQAQPLRPDAAKLPASVVAGGEPGSLITTVQQQLLVEMNDSAERPYARRVVDPGNLYGEIGAAMSAGSHDVSDLVAGYRLEVASRLIRVLSRALSKRSFGPRFTLWFSRPGLALLPAVVDPPRLLMLAALLGSAVLILSAGAPAPNAPASIPFIVAVVVALASAVLGAIQTLSGHRRWKRLALIPQVATDEARESRRRAVWACFGAWAVAILAGLGAVARAALVGLDLGFWVLVVVEIAFSLVAGHCGQRVLRRPTVPQVLGAALGLGVSGVLVGGALVAAGGLLDFFRSVSGQLPQWGAAAFGALDGSAGSALVVAVTGALAVLLLTCGWTWGVAPERGVGWSMVAVWLPTAVIIGALAALAGWVVYSGAVPSIGEGWAAVATWTVCWFIWGTLMWWVGEIPWLQKAYKPRDVPTRS
jgi:hypothetical protein